MELSCGIRPIGTVFQTTPDGYIVNPCEKNNLQNKWREILDSLVVYLSDVTGDDCHSIYVRGSVAQGKAIDHVSDIDMILVSNSSKIDTNQKSEMDAAIAKIQTNNEFIKWIDLQFVPLNQLNPKEVLRSDYVFNAMFTISTQSLCLLGTDLSKQLPRFKASRTTAMLLFRNLDLMLEAFLNELKQHNVHADLSVYSRYLGKVLLRHAALLYMAHESIYIRDLYPCYKRFSSIYPEQEEMALRALSFFVNGCDSLTELTTLAEQFSRWLKLEANRLFT